ncbi:MAG: amidohydrolase family protein [Actinocatenispora sp.]
MTGPGVVDSHHHFWQLRRQSQPWRTNHHEAIARDFEPAELAGQLRMAGVDATVLVQSVDTPDENRELLAYAGAADFVAGVVGWLPLADPVAARRELDGWAPRDGWRGARCLIGRGETGWLTADGTLAVLNELADRALCWDVVPVTGEQVDTVCAVADALPRLRIVVDHLARPPLDTSSWQPWAERLERLASRPNVAVKVSVGIDALTGWRPWSADALVRYVRHALVSFGAGRLMLASNWPVVLLRRAYPEAWRDLRDAVTAAGAGPDELAAVAGGTATRWYRLGDDAAARP